MKKIFLLAAILLSTQAQAVRLQCDLEDTNPKNQSHTAFTLELADQRARVVAGHSRIISLDTNSRGYAITLVSEAGIVAEDDGPLTDSERYGGDLTLNRHSLRLSVYSRIADTERFYKGQCYESDPKF